MDLSVFQLQLDMVSISCTFSTEFMIYLFVFISFYFVVIWVDLIVNIKRIIFHTFFSRKHIPLFHATYMINQYYLHYNIIQKLIVYWFNPCWIKSSFHFIKFCNRTRLWKLQQLSLLISLNLFHKSFSHFQTTFIIHMHSYHSHSFNIKVYWHNFSYFLIL